MIRRIWPAILNRGRKPKTEIKYLPAYFAKTDSGVRWQVRSHGNVIARGESKDFISATEDARESVYPHKIVVTRKSYE